jgi:hypothetical protein
MEIKIKKILVGSISAILSAGILIYAIETNRSLNQILTGFVLFVFPFTFLSILSTRTGSFVLVFSSALVGFVVSKNSYDDFWLGIILAALIGGIFYYYLTIPAIRAMRNYKPFSSKEFKESIKTLDDKNNPQL